MLNDTASCIRDSERSIGIDSLDFDAWNTLATVAYSRADYVVCRQYLDKAISAKHDFAIAIKNLGLLNLKLGMTQAACTDFQSASYIGNEDAKGLYVQYCK